MATPIATPGTTLEHVPPEIMTMIIQASKLRESDWDPEMVIKPILDSQDVFALRLSSRQLSSTTTDGFIRRFFSVRKHMLSRSSIQCLLEIATNPKFSPHVREVAFGPERLSPDLHHSINCSALNMNPDDSAGWIRADQELAEANWAEAYLDKWHFLIRDQIAFDSECVHYLRIALANLPNLRQVRLDGLPTGQDSWKGTWGARSLVRELGLPEKDGWSPDVEIILNDEDYRDDSLPPQFTTVLEALEDIEERKDWTLAVTFDTSDGDFSPSPTFSMTTGLWDTYRHRVGSLEFISTSNGVRECLLVAYSASCRNLTKLTLRDVDILDVETNLLAVSGTYQLQHLVVKGSLVSNGLLASYLKAHKQTLKELDFQKVTLIPSNDHDIYPTWRTMFETMLEIPKLRTVQLVALWQRFNGDEEEHNQLVAKGAFFVRRRELTAYKDEIAAKLGKAAKESFYVGMQYNGVLAELQFPKGV